VGKDEGERVWFGKRGPFSTDRACVVLPVCACIGSGIVMATAKKFRPRLMASLWVPALVHDIMGLPLAILLAFRFQDSYERWWNSRCRVEEMTSDVVLLASATALSLPPREGMGTLTVGPSQEAANEASRIRARLLALYEAYLGFVEMRIHGGDSDGLNRDDTGVLWLHPKVALKDFPEDLAGVTAVSDPTLWCTSAIDACFLRLEGIGAITGDWAASLYSSLARLEKNVGQCMMVITQKSPAPFVVHLRSILIIFCFFLPFSLAQKVQPHLIIPIQAAVSVAFIGTECCCREMENPFGSDDDDIPLRRLMHKAMQLVRHAKTAAAFEMSCEPVGTS